jgi:prepilin-type processing-associated H-X9-DG protein
MLQYSQDYDDTLPSARTGPNGTGQNKWVDVIQPYVKSTQLFNCPSDSNTGRNYVHPPSARTGAQFGSYVLNALYADTTGPASSPALYPTRLSKITNASTTVYAADGSYDNINDPWLYAWNTGWQYPTLDTTQQPFRLRDTSGNGGEGAFVERHLETTNVLWCDGHVKAQKLSALIAKKCDNNSLVVYPTSPSKKTEA